MKKLITLLLFILISAGTAFAETVSLSTYYPAPFGAYDRMRLVPRAVAPLCDGTLEGLMYFDSGKELLQICIGGVFRSGIGAWVQNDIGSPATRTNLYPSEMDSATPLTDIRVGIGTKTPGIPLDVVGTAVAGIRYTKTGSADARIGIADPTQAWSIASGWGTAGDFSILQEGVDARLYINQLGNVGIGINNPGARLEARGGISALPTSAGSSVEAALRAGASGTSAILDIGTKGAGPAAAWLQSRQRGNYANNFNLLLNPNGGNVGIGTTNPQNLLHIVNPTGGLARIEIEGSATRGNYIGVIGSDNIEIAADEDNNGGGSSIRFRTDAIEKMRITDIGRVGIGTPAPGTPLDVIGHIRTNRYLMINSWAGTFGAGNGQLWYDGVGGDGNAIGYLGLGDDTGNDRLIIQRGSGNVGIGTTAPTQRLTINGRIRLNNATANYGNLMVTYTNSNYYAVYAP